MTAAATVLLLLLPIIAVAQPLFEDQCVVPVELTFRGPRGMPGDIVELSDGRLLLAYDRQGYWAGDAGTGLWGRHSDDRGATWSDEFPLLLDPPGGMVRYLRPRLLR